MPDIKLDNRLYLSGLNPQKRKELENFLTIPNPEYIKKERMGFWLGKTPKTLCLYENDGGTLICPSGVWHTSLLEDEFSIFDITDNRVDNCNVDFNADVELYDYQGRAVDKLFHEQGGILQAPTGSGKTQMGIALAVLIGQRTLWLTHTSDLLNQSKKRAEKYISGDKIGTITDGKVNLGECITFATIQTMAKLDLSRYADLFGTVIVDECHHVVGTPTKMMQFYKVIDNMRARYKYGLSATVHRADGLIRSTFAILGDVKAVVTQEDVGDKVVPIGIYPRFTDNYLTEDCLMPDGTLSYTKTISYLSDNAKRNHLIVDDITAEYEDDKHILVLCHRVEHLRILANRLNMNGIPCEIIYGAVSEKERERIIEETRSGDNRILIATYSLAKEGLDIPILDRLFLTTPQKDYAIVTQSIGRISRSYPGKEEAIVYDYVDDDRYFVNAYKRRCTHYKKANCYAVEKET